MVQSKNEVPFLPMNNKSMHDYIDNLFKKISEVPEVSRGVNLLHQLQHCRESDRPISVIHHTMEALEQAMHMWQSCVNQQIFALVEEQKTLSERTVQVSVRLSCIPQGRPRRSRTLCRYDIYDMMMHVRSGLAALAPARGGRCCACDNEVGKCAALKCFVFTYVCNSAH